MRRIVLWLMSTATVLVLLFGYRTSTNTPAAAESSAVTPYRAGTTTGSATASSSSPAPATGGGTTVTAPSSTAASGTGASASSSNASATTTYTGDAAATRWGDVQVAITVSGGQITAVDVPVYPSGNNKDQQINARALPVLVQETVAAQSADIDMVSGATITSEGYLASLQSALDQAGL